ncbi:hypothetical protein HGRIS_001658 [Hohenbuehelia grisea]|uniref:Uncharacterized protein n=1 Tax=Hohenbuehelia grisea TaxID=104357 RepID=A0ABR3JI68_9AGAR
MIHPKLNVHRRDDDDSDIVAVVVPPKDVTASVRRDSPPAKALLPPFEIPRSQPTETSVSERANIIAPDARVDESISIHILSLSTSAPASTIPATGGASIDTMIPVPTLTTTPVPILIRNMNTDSSSQSAHHTLVPILVAGFAPLGVVALVCAISIWRWRSRRRAFRVQAAAAHLGDDPAGANGNENGFRAPDLVHGPSVTFAASAASIPS